MKPLPPEPTEQFPEQWQSLQQAAETAQIPFADEQQLKAACARVFPFSEFVARSCIQAPAMLADLIESRDLHHSYDSEEYLQRLRQQIADVDDQEQLSARLRRFRRREMVRIAWRDLSGSADLAETMADLTRFADACIEESLGRLHRWQWRRYGTPVGEDGTEQHLVVIGMGKLGGEELNFSSDIDLIFAYPQSGMTQGEDRRISCEEFFSRLSRGLLQVLGRATADGIVFRVDMRLRPFGENGPIAMSFEAMEQYYSLQGREWERYAWIKARVVAGDAAAGADLLERLKPFVYRRYLDFGAFESLRKMKQKINLEIRRKGMQNDIKLGRGGIREIEFFAQVFQLIRGGVVSTFQERSLLKVLAILAQAGTIPRSVFYELSQAYQFYRILENRLQQVADQQTHRLPGDGPERRRLARSLGFADEDQFETRLQEHRNIVHHHFTMLLQAAEEEPQDEESRIPADFWLGESDPERREQILAEAGFDNPAEALALIESFRSDPALRSMGQEGQDRLARLVPLLLRYAGQCTNALPPLRRILDLLKAIEGRVSYLALLLENPESLVHLVRLVSASSLLATFLARHPLLLDELLDPRTLYSPPSRESLQKEICQRLERLPDDLELQMEELRVFKQVNVLRVAAADVTEVLALMRVSDHLSDIAEVALGEVLEVAWKHLSTKHGLPVCELSGGESTGKGFAVIAYGKLGGLELGYDSDLDLVFLHAGAQGHTRESDRPIENSLFFARLGQRVIHILTATTRVGTLYETDMRLRPSGSSGILVSHVEGFRDYQLNEAWTWEHQALIRARAVGGDSRLMQRFEQIRKEALAVPRDTEKLRDEVFQMRRRMRRELLKTQPDVFDLKQSAGGIVDIEFLVQYLVLLKSHQYPQLLEWTDNVRLIQTLLETGVIDEFSAHQLKHAYLIYRAMAHRLGLQQQPARVPLRRVHRLQQAVNRIWSEFFPEA
jgi:glutamate-ammonia-ligase adenylyltransferase